MYTNSRHWQVSQEWTGSRHDSKQKTQPTTRKHPKQQNTQKHSQTKNKQKRREESDRRSSSKTIDEKGGDSIVSNQVLVWRNKTNRKTDTKITLSYRRVSEATQHYANQGFFFSVQRLRGFRQVVTQAFTCRKLNWYAWKATKESWCGPLHSP